MGKKAELTGAIADLTNRVHALRQSVDALRLAVLNNTLETHAARGRAEVMDTAKIAKDPPAKKAT